MGNPVVHFEIRTGDPDKMREFYGRLFGWSYPEGGIPGYTYVDSGIPDALPGGIGPTQGGSDLVTVFVGVEDVEKTLKEAESLGGRIVQPATHVPGVTFGLFADTGGHVLGVAAQDREAA